MMLNIVLVGVYARYYWDGKQGGVPCSSLLQPFTRAFVFHLGTIAFGSLIIAIVKVLRAFLEYLEKKVEDKTGRLSSTDLFSVMHAVVVPP